MSAAAQAASHAAAQSPAATAERARSAARCDCSTSISAPPGSDNANSRRPASTSRPSTTRTFDNSALNASSGSAGGRPGHNTPINSSRATGRSRLTANTASTNGP